MVYYNIIVIVSYIIHTLRGSELPLAVSPWDSDATLTDRNIIPDKHCMNQYIALLSA